MTTPFETILKTTPPCISEDWLQGRTGFGGILAALALQELSSLLDTDRQPISLNVQFVGPVVPGTMKVAPSIIRRGRYLTQGCVSIEQNGKVAVEAQAVFGTERASELKLESKSLTLSKTIEASLPLSESVARNFPNFIQHFECHYTESGFPFSGEVREILADSAGTDNGPLVTLDWSLFSMLGHLHYYRCTTNPSRRAQCIGMFNFTVNRLTQSTSVKSSANTMQRHCTRRQVSQQPTLSFLLTVRLLHLDVSWWPFSNKQPKVLFAITLIKLMRFAIQRKSVLSLIAESISHPTVKEEAVITLPIAIRDKLKAWFTKNSIELFTTTIRYT